MTADLMATKRHKRNPSGTEDHPRAYRRHESFAARRIFAPFCGNQMPWISSLVPFSFAANFNQEFKP